MNKRIKIKAGVLAGALALATGCEPSQPSPQAPPAEVRGESISAPVTPKAVPADSTGPAKEASAFSEAPAPADNTPGTVLPSGLKIANVTNEAPVAKAAEPLTKTEDGFLQVGFDRLASFNYEVPDGPVVEVKEGEKPAPAKQDQIPATVKLLDRKRIALQGFMLPLKVENGLITELLIMRDQSMCCYGSVPKINEWVSVKMTGKGVKPIMDQAVTLYGTLKVGEMLENGYLVGIYQMDGERMSGPLEL